MISVCFQGKPFNNTVIQVYAPTSNAEKAEVEQFYQDLQDLQDFLGGSDSKASVYNAGDLGLILGLGRCPGEGNGNPVQYSCPRKFYGLRSLVQATVHGVAD